GRGRGRARSRVRGRKTSPMGRRVAHRRLVRPLLERPRGVDAVAVLSVAEPRGRAADVDLLELDERAETGEERRLDVAGELARGPAVVDERVDLVDAVVLVRDDASHEHAGQSADERLGLLGEWLGAGRETVVSA